MRRSLCVFAVLALLVAVAPAASADNGPSHEEVVAAIDDGVGWLAAQQSDDGHWGDWEECAVTALAVKKLMHHAVDSRWGLGLPSPFDEGNPYKASIEAGLNWLFENCVFEMQIAEQPAGDPDSDGDGIGVYWDFWSRTYSSGIGLMTLCESVELDRVVESGPLAGWSYADVAKDTMDYLAFSQTDATWGNYRGGWSYSENGDWSDQSNSGYAALGLGFAETAWPGGCGFEVPQFVKDELNLWIDYIQDDVTGDEHDGGSGYADPPWANILRTGNLLQEMALVGDDATSGRVGDALDYMCRHWHEENTDPGWRGHPSANASYQAAFTAMKGFTSLGIAHIPCEPEPIDWQSDFETVLLDEQHPDGGWPHTDWDWGSEPILSTTWALLTLQKAAPPFTVPVDIKPTSCPNPFNMGGNGVLPVAILGAAGLDVTQIDPSTVELMGISPLRWAYEDVATPYEPYTGKEGAYDCNEYGPDGYLDLTFKFKMQEVAAALGEVNDGDVLVLAVTGSLSTGESFVGEDVVVILDKGKK